MTLETAASVPASGAAADASLPFVSVLIPVKDGLDLLRQCIQDLLEQNYPADRLEVVVIDNGSTTSPATVLPDDSRVSLLAESRPGAYRARNVGLTVAKGELLAFTDADCRPANDWLRQVAEYLTAHPDVDMIGGAVQIAYASGDPRNGPEWYEYVQGFPQERYVASGFAVTANMVTRRSVFDRVGPFDGDLKSGGDTEWGRRVRDSGGTVRYLANAVVRHPARDTWIELRTKTARTTNGVVDRAFMRAHPRRELAGLLARQLVRSVVLPVTVARLSLPSSSARWKYLVTRWRVDGVITAVLIRGLVAGPAT